MPTIKPYTAEQWLALLEIFVIFVLSVLVLQTGIVPAEYRIHLYAFVYSLVLPLIFFHGLSLHDLTIRADNLVKASTSFGIVTILLLIGGFILAFVLEYRVQTDIMRVITPAQYTLFSVPIQQVVFFGFLYNRLTILTDNRTLIAIALAVLFAACHLPWDNLEIMVITFSIGLLWALLHVRTPNLFWTYTLHTILGLFSLVIVQLS